MSWALSRFRYTILKKLFLNLKLIKSTSPAVRGASPALEPWTQPSTTAQSLAAASLEMFRKKIFVSRKTLQDLKISPKSIIDGRQSTQRIWSSMLQLHILVSVLISQITNCKLTKIPRSLQRIRISTACANLLWHSHLRWDQQVRVCIERASKLHTRF